MVLTWCLVCDSAPDENGVCACNPSIYYTCGHCGSEVAVGTHCFCASNSTEESSADDYSMKFEPVEQGFRITFDNGWTVKTEKADPDDPGKIRIQAFMPQGFQIRAFGYGEFVINCNDLAVVLMQTSQITKGAQASEEYANQSFEAMLEGLLFGVAA
jgi:hypothetical protein